MGENAGTNATADDVAEFELYPIHLAALRARHIDNYPLLRVSNMLGIDAGWLPHETVWVYIGRVARLVLARWDELPPPQQEAIRAMLEFSR